MENKYLNNTSIPIIFVITILISCQTGPKERPNKADKPINTPHLSLTLMVNAMVDSLLTFPPIVDATEQRRPVVYVDEIKNKTMEHIDMESLTDSITTKMIQSGKFRFTDMTVVDEILKQQEWQNIDFDPDFSPLGKVIGAEYMLYGNLSANEIRVGRSRLVEYRLTLKFLNVETGIKIGRAHV